MTGQSISTLRQSLELDPFALAALLGVHVSSVYRWEKNWVKDNKIDPLQVLVLDGIARVPTKQRADLGRKIRDALMSGGTLAALYVALATITKDK